MKSKVAQALHRKSRLAITQIRPEADNNTDGANLCELIDGILLRALGERGFPMTSITLRTDDQCAHVDSSGECGLLNLA